MKSRKKTDYFKYPPLIASSLTFFSICAMFFSIHASANTTNNSVISNEYIVTLHAENSVYDYNNSAKAQSIITDQAHNLESEYNIQMITTYSSINAVLFQGSAVEIEQLKKDPSVKSIETNKIFSVSPIIKTNNNQPNPDWGLDRSDQHDLPLNKNYHFDYNAKNVSAYVIDTGIYTANNDFGGRARKGYNAIGNNTNSDDCNGHGTHVAGILGSGTYGIAKATTLYGVRVLGCDGSGSLSNVLKGIQWVIDNAQKPAVANISLGGGRSSSFDAAVTQLVRSGVSTAYASGNSNSDACNFSPRSSLAVAVGSTTISDSRSNFSNWGSCVDIFAPGTNIRSTWIGFPTANIVLSGTSMASPMTAGAIALILAENPDYTPAQVKEALLSRSSKNKLTNLRGSPNRLIYTLDDEPIVPEEPEITPPCNDDEQCLVNGKPISESGEQSSSKFFYIDVPKDADLLTIETSDGTGDVDLYVKNGSIPEKFSFDCRPYRNGTSEKCTFTSPESGRWHIMLYGWRDYANVNLVATYTPSDLPEPEPDLCDGRENCLENDEAIDVEGTPGSERNYIIPVKEGSSNLTITLEQGEGIADILVSHGQQPTRAKNDCAPFGNGGNEVCTFTNPQVGDWHILVKGWSDYQGKIVAKYE